MIDARIPWILGLKEHFGSMLKTLGSSAQEMGSSASALERPTSKAQAHIHLSARGLTNAAAILFHLGLRVLKRKELSFSYLD
jgi:hypothetical protein